MAMFDILPTAFIFFAGAIIVALLPSGRIRSAISLLIPILAGWQVYNLPAGVCEGCVRDAQCLTVKRD